MTYPFMCALKLNACTQAHSEQNLHSCTYIPNGTKLPSLSGPLSLDWINHCYLCPSFDLSFSHSIRLSFPLFQGRRVPGGGNPVDRRGESGHARTGNSWPQPQGPDFQAPAQLDLFVYLSIQGSLHEPVISRLFFDKKKIGSASKDTSHTSMLNVKTALGFRL